MFTIRKKTSTELLVCRLNKVVSRLCEPATFDSFHTLSHFHLLEILFSMKLVVRGSLNQRGWLLRNKKDRLVNTTERKKEKKQVNKIYELSFDKLQPVVKYQCVKQHVSIGLNFNVIDRSVTFHFSICSIKWFSSSLLVHRGFWLPVENMSLARLRKVSYLSLCWCILDLLRICTHNDTPILK